MEVVVAALSRDPPSALSRDPPSAVRFVWGPSDAVRLEGASGLRWRGGHVRPGRAHAHAGGVEVAGESRRGRRGGLSGRRARGKFEIGGRLKMRVFWSKIFINTSKGYIMAYFEEG